MIRDLLTDRATTLAEFGITWFCQSTALLLLGLLAGRLARGRGPAVQSTIYRTTLAAVLICPVASGLLAAAGVDGISLRLPTPGPAVGDAPEPPSPPIPATPTLPGWAEANPTPAGSFEAIDPAVDLVSEPAAAPGPIPITDEPIKPPVAAGFTPPVPTGRSTWIPGAVVVGLAGWGLGASWLGLRLLAAARRMARVRDGAIPAGPEAEAVCRALAERMRLVTPAVLRSPFLTGPCVEGLTRPAILLPEDDAYSDLNATLVHELAHLIRRDCLWNLLRRLAAALLWFQPLLWALSRRIEVTAEETCDDHVVEFGADRARYAGLLLELAGRNLPPLSPVGVGMVSLRSLLARRIVRILDSSRALSTQAGRKAVLTTLLAGAVGTLLAGLVAVGGREPKARADQAPPATDPTPGVLTGRVVDAAGKPVPGATVWAISGRSKSREPGLDGIYENEYREVARATTDADGRYAIGDPEPERGPDGKPIAGFSHYITKLGFGLSPFMQDYNLPLIPDDVPVTGRVVDLEGRPVAGVRVRPTQLYMPWPAAKDLEDSGPGWFDVGKSLNYGDEYLATLPPILTDADGRFRMDGIGRRRMVELEITRPDLARKRVRVVTRAMDRVAEPPGGNRVLGINEPGEYGANCTIAVEPTRIIEGVVRDVETGRPIPGTLVTAQRLDQDNLVGTGEVVSRTDAEGRYRLVGLPKCKAPALAVYPALDQPYFINDFLEVPVEPGYEPVRFDVALRRARWITGRVFDLKSNEPVPAVVEYFPLLANPRAKDYPNFDPDVTNSGPANRRYKTDAAGRYRIPGLPGVGVVAARADEGAYRVGFGAAEIAGKIDHDQLPTYDRINVKNYQAIRGVDLPPEAEATTADLPLDPGGTIVLRLVDAAGAPVEGADTNGLFPIGANGTHVLDHASLARVAGLEAGKPRTVWIRQQKRRIGAVVELPADGPRDGREQVVVLRPLATVTGRLIGTEATLAIEVDVELKRADNVTLPGAMEYTSHLDRVSPDADGRFRFDAIPAGGSFDLMVRDGAPRLDARRVATSHFKTFEPAVGLTVGPGQVVDLGTFDVTTGRKVAPPAAAPNGPALETRAGQVVGPDGRPIPGAVVRAVLGQLWDSGDDRVSPRRELRETARATTDADGRYSLRVESPVEGPDKLATGFGGTVVVFAQAPGYGVGKWVDGRIAPLVTDDVPIAGRLVDPEGNPIAGATITAGTIAMPRPGYPWPAGSALDRSGVDGIDRLGNQHRDLIAPATSDADGRFVVAGIGRDRLVELEIRRAGSAFKRVFAATRRQDRIVEPPTDRERGNLLTDPGQYGASCTIVVEPERIIAGQVRDVVTGEPIADTRVAAMQVDRTKPIFPGDIVARTDAQGRYRLTGLPKVASLMIQVFPPVDRPYFDQPQIDVPLTPGYDPVAFDVPLRAGVWVTGRVTNGRTGEPVAANIGYTPYLDNRAAPDYPNFRPVLSLALPKRHRTDAAGRFRVLALPGRGIVMARADGSEFRVGVGAKAVATGIMDRGPLTTYDRIAPSQFHAVSAVDIPPAAGEFARDLTVDPGGSVEIRLVDAAGRPVEGAFIPYGRYPPGGAGGSQLPADQSSFRATGLEPDKGRTVVVRHKARGLGAVTDLPADHSADAAGLTLVLHPMATVFGRVVDDAGRPAAGTVTVLTGPGGRVTDLLDSFRNYRLAAGPLDADGRFRLAGIPAGGTYRVEVLTRPDGAPNAARPTIVDLAPVTPEPGAVLDLGALDAATGRPVGAISNPATPASSTERPAPAPTTRTKAGRVVDPDGRPIAGAEVLTLVIGRAGRTLDRPRPEADVRELARVRVDIEGRFAITYPELRPIDGANQTTFTYAIAPGFGPVRFADEPVVTLPRDDIPVRGRVVNLEGKPVAGASVRIQSVYDRLADAVPEEPGPAFFDIKANQQLYGYSVLFPDPAIADADGRFRLDGLGRGRLAKVEITGPTTALQEATIVTRRGGWIADVGPEREGYPRKATDDPGQHGAECTIAVEPTRVIQGIVCDAVTAEPISGVLVASGEIRQGLSYLEGMISARTDAQGCYRLVGLPREVLSVSLYPPSDRPYFVTQRLPVPASPGYEPVTLDVPLRAGIWITGRVAERQDDAPVAAAVDYFPYLDNPAAPSYPNFRTNMVMSGGMLVHARTDAQGRYRVVGLPGRGAVVARTDDPSYLPGFGGVEILADPTAPKGRPGMLPTYDRIDPARYQAVRPVDVPPGVGEFVCDLPVDPGGSLVIRPVDPAGRPVTGVLVRHDQTPTVGTGGVGQRADSPTIRVGGLAANQPRTFVIKQSTLNLGVVLELPAAAPVDGRELTVTLQPTATVVGRVLDAAGEPVAGRMDVVIPQAGDSAINLGYTITDADGRFRVAGVPTGAAVTARFRRLTEPKRSSNLTTATPIELPIRPEPGATVDLGTLDVTTGKAVEAVPKP